MPGDSPCFASPSTPAPENIAQPHLDAAHAACVARIDGRLASLDAFFHEAQASSRDFADAALGWGSKWRMVADHAPFVETERHAPYLRSQFEAHIFSTDELQQVVEGLLRDYFNDVSAIEGQMLVDLRADVENLAAGYAIAELDQDAFAHSYAEIIARLSSRVGDHLPGEIGGQLVSFVAGEILSKVAIRMGVSAGILGAGASSSWVTCGVGLVVGVVVDQVVSAIWNWWADPSGDLASELNSQLDQLAAELKASIRERLTAFAAERAQLRHDAVLMLLQSSNP